MDIIDRAQRIQEQALDAAIRAARGDIPPGTAGECRRCGVDSMRLIDGACAKCRDACEKGICR